MTTSGYAVVDELSGMVINIRFPPNYKRGARAWVKWFIRKRSQNSVVECQPAKIRHWETPSENFAEE
jgi:hypothetical protein